MTVPEKLERLRAMAMKDDDLRKALLDTKAAEDPLSAFCRIATDQGLPLFPMEIIAFGEETYAAMRRSTNGGGENSPLLSWEDDYYELFLAQL